MTRRNRELLTVIMIVSLALVSFLFGFLLNELLDRRSGRVAAGNIGQDFDVFWEAWSKIEESYIGGLPSSKQMTYGAVRGSIDVLGDPYTIFIEPQARDQERDSLRGNFGGVGALLERNDSGDIVLSPIAGNPAELAGILDGDILIAVEGQPISQDMTIEEIAELIRGEEGSKVTLTILHPNASEPVDITIVRAAILLPSVSFSILEENPTIGYIKLSRFSGESSAEMEEAILELQQMGVEKLILDLRQNGGGLLNAAVEISNHFLADGPVVFQISKDEKEKKFEASNGTSAGDMPLVVLVDNGTASAAEIVAGALQDRDRGTLIGSKTFGKGSVQVAYDLSDGSSVHVTSARWLTPDRHQIDQQGLTPDILVEVTKGAMEDGQDKVLEEALAFLTRVVAN